MYRSFGKRWIDLLAATALLVVLAIPLVLLAILVRWKLGSPIFFRQGRPGLRGEPFRLLKFRTMTDGRDGVGNLLPDSDRLTPFGRFLRGSSLDELPELWNVVKGEMSLVGPRPLLTRYLERYSKEQGRRHEARPGITGWAQVNGRNSLSWDDRFAMDVWYVDHCNLFLDVKILWRTIGKVLKRDGISAEGHATMPEFGGPGR